MALQVGINSYVSFDEADIYFEDRLDSSKWTDSSDLIRERSLVTATANLDNMSWAGVAVSETQSLAFPRVGSYYEPKLGYEISFPDDIPDRIKIATYELAYHLINNDNSQDNTGTVRSIKVGPIELIDIRDPSTPSVVRKSISPMLGPPGRGGTGANLWWRAN